MELIRTVEHIDPEALAGVFFLITTIIGSISTAAATFKKRLKDNAVHLIGSAEEQFFDQEKAGAAKRTYAVEKLQLMVPRMFRPFFSKKLLAQMVDSSFAAVSRYSTVHSAALSVESLPKESLSELHTEKGEDSLTQAPNCAFLMDGCQQSTVRVLTLRSQRGTLLQIKYGVCRRKRSGDTR